MPPPVLYDPKYIKSVDHYLKQSQDNLYEFHKTRSRASNSFEEKVKANLPSKEDFATFIGVSRKTLYNWRDEYPDFAIALEKIEQEQLKRLINGGLDGTYNSTIAKLILSSNHGMRDGIDATTNGKEINSFTEEQVAKIAERVSRRRDGSGSSPV